MWLQPLVNDGFCGSLTIPAGDFVSMLVECLASVADGGTISSNMIQRLVLAVILFLSIYKTVSHFSMDRTFNYSLLANIVSCCEGKSY